MTRLYSDEQVIQMIGAVIRDKRRLENYIRGLESDLRGARQKIERLEDTLTPDMWLKFFSESSLT